MRRTSWQNSVLSLSRLWQSSTLARDCLTKNSLLQVVTECYVPATSSTSRVASSLPRMPYGGCAKLFCKRSVKKKTTKRRRISISQMSRTELARVMPWREIVSWKEYDTQKLGWRRCTYTHQSGSWKDWGPRVERTTAGVSSKQRRAMVRCSRERLLYICHHSCKRVAGKSSVIK